MTLNIHAYDHDMSVWIVTVWIIKTILRINGNTFGGAHSTSFRMCVITKCEELQLTFKSGAYLIGNGYGAMALYDLAQHKYLTGSSLKWMNVQGGDRISCARGILRLHFPCW